MKIKLIVMILIILIIIITNITDIRSNKLLAAEKAQCAICQVVEDKFECWIFQPEGGLTCTLRNNGDECELRGVCP